MSAALVHRCGPDCPPWHASRQALTAWRGPRDFTVDVHCHLWTPQVEPLIADTPQKRGELDVMRQVQGEASVAHNEAAMMPFAIHKMSTLDERLHDMDAMGVDVQVLSPSPTQYCYWAEPDLAREIVRLQNEHLAEQCARHPDRLVAFGTVALQHPAMAVEQLRHCVRTLGMVGVEVSSLIGVAELSDPRFAAFWAEVEALDCVVFLHPLGTTMGERLDTHYLSNIIGQPLETTVALSKLILAGVFDRHPALKLIAAHGGGYLGAYAGRLDHGWAVRPEARTCKWPPSDYLRRIWFDTVVYEPRQLRALAEAVGITQLLVGTDYPFDMGMDQVHATLAAAGFDAAQRRRVLGDNARQLFGRRLPTEEFR